jgi:dynein heavy chain 1
MYMEYESFERAMRSAGSVFHAWDDLIKEFTNVAREVTRKRSEKFLPIKIHPAHAKLQERTEYLGGFRKQHHQLETVTMSDAIASDFKRGLDGAPAEKQGLALMDIDMEQEVKTAYESVKNVDVLDTSAGVWNFPSFLVSYLNSFVAHIRGHRDMGRRRDGV